MTNFGILEFIIILLVCLVGLALAGGIGFFIYWRTRSKPAGSHTIQCPGCGKDVSSGMQFCPHCGVRITPPAEF